MEQLSNSFKVLYSKVHVMRESAQKVGTKCERMRVNIQKDNDQYDELLSYTVYMAVILEKHIFT